MLDSIKLIGYHRGMLDDTVRTEQYQKAIHAMVRPGDVVLDLGSGTGVLAFFACQAGARKVYAAEAGPMAQLTRRLSAANGFDDRVVVLNDYSSHLALPEPVDVIVTETMGSLGLEEGILGWVIDARRRLLRDGGSIVPSRLCIMAAPAQVPETYARYDAWAVRGFDLDFALVRPYAINNLWRIATLAEQELLAEPSVVMDLDLCTVEADHALGSATYVVQRAGVLHGIGAWFSADLGAGVTLTNDASTPSWSHCLFPVADPVEVRAGDVVTFALISAQNGQVYTWKVRCQRPGGHGGTARVLAKFEHTNLAGFPRSKREIGRQVKSYAPALTRKGEAARTLLSLIDGQRSIGDLADELYQQYADCFGSSEAAVAFVRGNIDHFA